METARVANEFGSKPPEVQVDEVVEVEAPEDQEVEYRLSEDELRTKLMQEYENAKTFQWQVITNRELAYEYFYKRRPHPPKDKTKSGAVSQDIQNSIISTMGEVKSAFRKSELFEVLPDSTRSKEQAQAETDALNYIFFDRNNGRLVLNNVVFDALLQENCIVKVWVEERQLVEYKTFEDVDELVLPSLTDNADEDVDIEIMSQYQTQPEQLNDFGEMMEGAKYTIELKKITPSQKLRVDAVPLDEMRINADLATIDLQEARFVCHSRPISVSELLERGYDPVAIKRMPQFSIDYDGDTASRRAGSGDVTSYVTADESNELKRVFESYYRVDYDGDGIAELRRIVHSQNDILENDVVDFIPFAAGASIIMPHQFNGLSLFDRLQQIQDQKTIFLRQMIDNAIRANRERVGAIKGQVDMERLLSGANVVPITSPTALVPFPHEKILAETVGVLNYLDEIRSESGGNAIELTSENMIVPDQSAHATERLTSKLEVNADSIVESLSLSVMEGLFRILHKTLKNYWNGEMVVYKKDVPFRINPNQWDDLAVCRIKPNLSVGQRNAKLNALNNVILTYEKLAAQGLYGVMFDAQHIYNVMWEMGETAGLSSVESFYINPSSPDGQKRMQDYQKKQEEDRQMQMQLQMIQITQPEKMANLEGQFKLMQQQVGDAADMDQLKQELRAKYDEMALKLYEIQRKYSLEADKIDLEEEKAAIDAVLTEAGGRSE